MCLPEAPGASPPCPCCYQQLLVLLTCFLVPWVEVELDPEGSPGPVRVTGGGGHQAYAVHLRLDIVSLLQAQPKTAAVSTSKAVGFYFKH